MAQGARWHGRGGHEGCKQVILAILSRVYQRAHNVTEKRRMRKRLVMLQSRLEAHDMDMASMAHFPQNVQGRMREHREFIVKQIEAARGFV